MVISSDPKPLVDNSKKGQSNFHQRLPTAPPASVSTGGKGLVAPCQCRGLWQRGGRDGPANQTLYTSNTGLKKTLRAVLQD